MSAFAQQERRRATAFSCSLSDVGYANAILTVFSPLHLAFSSCDVV
jgi:hypothetical protein